MPFMQSRKSATKSPPSSSAPEPPDISRRPVPRSLNMPDLPTTVAEAAAALRAKTISSVELTTEFLRRAKALNPTLGAFISFTEDEALAAAAAADQLFGSGADRGPLQGILYATKDIIATAD